MNYPYYIYQVYQHYSDLSGIYVGGINISILGVVLALAISIFLIIKKLNPVLAMFLGVSVGAIVGSADLSQMMDIMLLGGRQVVGINIRIIAGGVLVGALVETGAAESLAKSIAEGLGSKRAIPAIALTAALMCSVGVFPPVAMLIIAPIALSIAHKAGVSKFAAILALSGGVKAGNVMSPNPSALAAAESFGVPISQMMVNSVLPALAAFAVTMLLCRMKRTRHFMVGAEDIESGADPQDLPPFGRAVVAPAVAIGLLMLNPVGDLMGIHFISSANLPMDPFYVLPIGAVAGMLAMGKGRGIIDVATKGVLRMAPVMLMMFGAGAIGGLITTSVFPAAMEHALSAAGLPAAFLAPLSSTVFSGVTGSNAAGVIIGGESFAATILEAGVPAMAGAVMLHAGGGFIDVMPHGNIFLASQQGMKCTMTERLKVIPYEAAVGFAKVTTATALFLAGFWG